MFSFTDLEHNKFLAYFERYLYFGSDSKTAGGTACASCSLPNFTHDSHNCTVLSPVLHHYAKQISWTHITRTARHIAATASTFSRSISTSTKEMLFSLMVPNYVTNICSRTTHIKHYGISQLNDVSALMQVLSIKKMYLKLKEHQVFV